MARSIDLSEVSTFAAGAEGPVGGRVFYLQARTPDETVTLKVEKQQVALLADYLERLIEAEGLPESAPAHMPDLEPPLDPEWTVGSILVAVNRATDQIVVIAKEIEDVAADSGDDAADDHAPEPAEARFALSSGQVEAFIEGARRVVSAGRPICPLCSGPMEPDGHACPRMN